ncbi:hypothetical protein MYX78_13670, partial [Acidobacteria bacterium AH-259-G07]|nr:hypothetical protein [Acidobacteria bacterium AH-259-G07]
SFSVSLYVVIFSRMQKRGRDAELSRLRLALRRHLDELKKAVKVVMARGALVKGNVYELARKCGKPNCACQRGQLHRSMVLSSSERGKTRLRVLPAGRVAEIRQKSEAYLRLRRARAQVTKSGREIVAGIDRIEQLRREDI